MKDKENRPLSEGFKHRTSVGKRLYQYVWALGTIAIIGILVLIGAISFITWKQLESHLQNARNHANAITQEFLLSAQNDLNLIRNFITSSPDEIDNIFRISLLRDRRISGLYLVDNDGSILQERYVPRTRLNANWLLSPQADSLFEKEFFSQHIFRGSKPIPDLLIAVPIMDQNQAKKKALVAQIDLSKFWSRLNLINVGKSGLIYVVDNSGKIILHRTMGFLTKDVFINDHINLDVKDLKTSNMLLTRKDGDYSLVSASYIDELDWLIVAEKPLADYTNALIVFLAVFCSSFLLVIIIVSRAEIFTRVEIIEPLKNLHTAVSQFKRGNLLYQSPSTGKHEFNDLSQVLNSLGHQLNQTLDDLGNNLSELEENRAALLTSEKKYRSVINTIHEVLFQTDASGNITFLNPAWKELTGFTIEESLGKQFVDFIAREDYDEHIFTLRDLLKDEIEIFSHEIRIKHALKEFCWVEIIARKNTNADNETSGIAGTINDITNRRRVYEQLKLIASVYTHAREAILICNEKGKIIEVNPSFTEITGYKRKNVIGKTLRQIRPFQQTPDFYGDLWRDLNNEGFWNGDIRIQNVSGTPYTISLTMSVVYDTKGKIQNFLGLFSDITERQAHQEELERIAHYDSLTGLPNRLLIIRILNETLQKPNQDLAVIYLDLDGFKEINDNYGHDVGDIFLREIATRMKQALRYQDTIGRLGGDEFVAILVGIKPNDEKLLLDRLLEATSTPIKVDGKTLYASASIGVTYYPQKKDCGPDRLLRQADQAMYTAKLLGKNQYYVFDLLKDTKLQGFNRTLDDLRHALIDNQFILYYQPQVNIETGEFIGVEALIRRRHPEKGLQSPAEFIPLIEDNELSIDIGNWVINEALSQINKWKQDNGLDLKVSVNISGFHLLQPDFIDSLKATLSKHNLLKKEVLSIEVLESSIIEDMEFTASVINQCEKLNIKFALDDFGTGYSTLTYLKNLPASQLKIDRSFVRDLVKDSSNMAIIDSIMTLANAFDREVIAEGVESFDHMELLLKLGCKFAQGYCIAYPMIASEIPQWLQEWVKEESWTKVTNSQKNIHKA